MHSNLLPMLIPNGKQPIALNNYIASSSNFGSTAISYFGLPYILIYDSTLNHVNTLVLNSSSFEGKVPSLIPTENIEGIGTSITKIIYDFKWVDDDNLILVSSGHIISILKRKADDNFELKKRFKLEYAKGEAVANHSSFGINIHVLATDETSIYVTSIFDRAIYKVSLLELGINL